MKGPSKAKNLKSYKFMPSKEYVAKKAAPKVAPKPAPKVAAKPMRKIRLPEVTVTATRIKKAAPAQESKPKVQPIKKQAPDTVYSQAKLYPGGHVQKYKVDSLEKADKVRFKNLADSTEKKGIVKARYDEADSEYIRRKLKLPTYAQERAMSGGKGVPGTQSGTGFRGVKSGKK